MLENYKWQFIGRILVILRAFYKIRFYVPMNRQKIQCWKIFLANRSFALYEKFVFHEAVIFFTTINLLLREIFQ